MARDVMTATAGARSRAIWASGDYADVADRLLPDLGALLVGAAGVRAGSRVLDVAAGAGNVAIAAAAGAGANVVALDVTPELLQAGRRVADRRGVTLDWVEGDAAHLPFADATFDTVLSCVGVMFVPDHQRAASEILRVCRPGGTIGLLSWTPEGFIGELFRTMAPFAPPPSPGAQSPALWGRESHVLRLFGDDVTHVRSRKGVVRNDSFERPLEYREYMKAVYGPTITTYLHAEENGDVEELDAAFGDLCERRFERLADGGWRVEKEYLITLATRA
jgi:ubiquinone/menaquinone biosynthesis C-methylase UbiE